MRSSRFLLYLAVGLMCTFAACGSTEQPLTPPEPPVEEEEGGDDESDLPSDAEGSILSGFTAGKCAVLLDLTARKGESETDNVTGRNLYSADYLLEVAGIPYFTTDNLATALEKGDFILLSSSLEAETLTPEECDTLTRWVAAGGVVAAPACASLSPALSTLFGITESKYSKLRARIEWNVASLIDKELEYMDQPEEKTISLANGESPDKPVEESIKTWGYTLGTGEALAAFESGEAAVVRNRVGEGCTYTFGLLWRDVVQRPQLNKDFDAQRWWSTGYESSGDAFPLFLRAAYTKYHPASVSKHTIPDGWQTVLIPTHDCDSRTAYDEMHYMSDYEESIGLKAHYFLTVHYYRDSTYLSAFYDDSSIVCIKKLLAAGHTVGSHSIGHFPDFSNTGRFPMKIVTKDQYRAHHDVEENRTIDGSTWAEVVLSKNILEEDLGITVRSFRTGHLCMNKHIPEACRTGRYAFSSCYAAGDVLGSFPYVERISNDWTGEQTGVLQMPLHFSDVMSDDPVDEENWYDKIPGWLEHLDKLKGNSAPAILLIHPNREWKMLMEQNLVEQMDRTTIGLYNFEDYGDFWNRRRSFAFSVMYSPDDAKIVIRIDNGDTADLHAQTLLVETAAGTPLENITVIDRNAMVLGTRIKKIADNKYFVVL